VWPHVRLRPSLEMGFLVTEQSRGWKSSTCSVESAEACKNIPGGSRLQIHTGADAQFGNTITIALNPPCKKELPVALNEFGIPVKERYRNEDLAKILGVHPATIQWRCDRNKYGEIKKDSAGRRYFTIDDVRRIVAQEQARNEFNLPNKPSYIAHTTPRSTKSEIPQNKKRSNATSAAARFLL